MDLYEFERAKSARAAQAKRKLKIYTSIFIQIEYFIIFYFLFSICFVLLYGILIGNCALLLCVAGNFKLKTVSI